MLMNIIVCCLNMLVFVYYIQKVGAKKSGLLIGEMIQIVKCPRRLDLHGLKQAATDIPYFTVWTFQFSSLSVTVTFSRSETILIFTLDS